MFNALVDQLVSLYKVLLNNDKDLGLVCRDALKLISFLKCECNDLIFNKTISLF